MEPLDCSICLRSFEPEDVPAVYTSGSALSYAQSLDDALEIADELWKSILTPLRESISEEDCTSLLCVNLLNPTIYNLAILEDENALRAAISLVYLQAMLLGQQPMGVKESDLFGHSLSTLLSARAGEDGA